MVDEHIDQSDMGEMSLDGMGVQPRASLRQAAGGPSGSLRRPGFHDQEFQEERVRASTTRNGEEQREHFTEEDPTKHASACVQHSWCTARAGGRVAPDGVHVVS